VPYVRCPGCSLDTYSAAGHSTTDACPRCGAALNGGVPSARHDGVVVLPRVRFAVTRETETQSAPGSDAPAAPPAS
jgi:ribosomal protein L34E